MLKKTLVLLTVVVSVFVIGMYINVGTDEYIMNEYIQEHYGEGSYGELIDDNDNEFIQFIVYEEGTPRWGHSIKREYYAHKYD